MAELTRGVPPGVTVRTGRDLDERPVVEIRAILKTPTNDGAAMRLIDDHGASAAQVSIVGSTGQMRTLCAVILRQCDLAEQSQRSLASLELIKGGRS